MTGPGFATFEVTYHDDTGYHPHRHLTVDSWYIPWPLLAALWRAATDGAGEIVDIRAVSRDRKGMLEAVKYVTKAWEIPKDKAGELRQVVFGKKRVWPLGGAKPAKVDKTCPGCGRPTCQCHVMDVGFADTVTLHKDRAVIQTWFSKQPIEIARKDGRWQVVDSLSWIGMSFACQTGQARVGPGP